MTTTYEPNTNKEGRKYLVAKGKEPSAKSVLEKIKNENNRGYEPANIGEPTNIGYMVSKGGKSELVRRELSDLNTSHERCKHASYEGNNDLGYCVMGEKQKRKELREGVEKLGKALQKKVEERKKIMDYIFGGPPGPPPGGGAGCPIMPDPQIN